MNPRIALFLAGIFLSTNLFASKKWTMSTVHFENGDSLRAEVSYLKGQRMPDFFRYIDPETGEKRSESIHTVQRLVMEGGWEYRKLMLHLDQSSRASKDLTADKAGKMVFDTVMARVLIESENTVLYLHSDDKNIRHFIHWDEERGAIELIYRRYLEIYFSEVEQGFQTNFYRPADLNVYRDSLEFIMRSCKKLMPDILELDYSERAMVKLYGKYFDCSGETVLQVRTEEEVITELWGGIGMQYLATNYSGFGAPTMDAAQISQTIFPHAQLFLRNSILSTRDKGFINLSAQFAEYDINGFHLNINNPEDYKIYDINLSFTSLKFLAGLERNFRLSDRVSIAPSAGVSFAFYLRLKQEMQRHNFLADDKAEPIVKFETLNAVKLTRRQERGWYVSLKTYVDPFVLNLYYNRNDGFSNLIHFDSAHHIFGASISYRFINRRSSF
jgi:hypothetical protein